MRTRWDHNEFNTPGEMVVRATFLVCLTAFTIGIILAVAGATMRDFELLALAAVLLVISGVARGWLRRRGIFNQPGLQVCSRLDPPAEGAHVAELVRLLQQWDELEGQRGSPGFDPWALQAIRHDIRVLVAADPALESVFHEARRAA